MPSWGRAGTRVVVSGALLLSIYMSLAAASLPGWPIANSFDGRGTAPTAAPSQIALAATASAGSPQAPGSNLGQDNGQPLAAAANQSSTPIASARSTTSPVSPSSSATATRTPAPWTPRPRPKPTPQPTPDLNRVYHVPVLMYHRILPNPAAGDSAPDLVVSPDNFAAQMKAFFDAGWHSITMATLAGDMETDATIPDKTFVITFDDGWSDGYDYAFPIMRQYGFVGTFFVITSRIDQAGVLSTQEMRALEAAGNDIGNHTENHVNLTTVSADRLTQEVELASEQIARATGHRPVSFAYPMGGIDTPVATLVSRVPDIKIAVHTGYGTHETWLGRYNVPRVRVHPDTSPGSLVVLAGR